MFVSKNHGPFHAYDFSHPLTVAADDFLQIFIHDVSNVEVDNATWRTSRCCLIPQLLAGVGDRATVHVHLSNSANVVVTGCLMLATAPQSGAAALISTLLQGPVGRHAALRIRMENCSNVTLTHNDSQLVIAGGSLVDSVLDLPAGSALLEDVELDFFLRRCAQVSACSAATRSGSVHLHKGQLINEIADCHAIARSRIQIHAEEIANVTVHDLRIEDGELVDEVLDATHIHYSSVRVDLLAVGNAHASSIAITEGELVDEVMDIQSINASTVRVTLDRVACARAGHLAIESGELMDELVDASERIRASDIHVIMNKVGCFAGVTATIRSGELVDEIVDTATLSDSNVNIQLHDVANMECQHLSLYDAQLLDEVIDCESLEAGCVVTLQVDSSACIQAASLAMHNSQLMDELIDCRATAPAVVKRRVFRCGQVNAQ